ncbi:hypothetical protein GCM10028818_60090 [Spirosoma horti]
MFRDSYPYHYCGVDRYKVRPNLVKTHLFRFNDKLGHAYIVRAELYPNNVYAIKYFLKAHRLSENRYNFLTGLGGGSRIFATCLKIMVYLYQRDPTVSFGIVGANLLKVDKKKDENKRFRIYSNIFGNVFPPTKFIHSQSTSDAAYFLINKERAMEDSTLPNKIEAEFDIAIT